jgi:hypothetical protein
VLTGVIGLVAILFSFMESFVLFLLLDLGTGNILLVPVLVYLRVSDVGVHIDGLVGVTWKTIEEIEWKEYMEAICLN